MESFANFVSVGDSWATANFISSQTVASVSSSQTIGELATVEFVTVGDGLAALQFLTEPQPLTAPNSCPLVVAPGGSRSGR